MSMVEIGTGFGGELVSTGIGMVFLHAEDIGYLVNHPMRKKKRKL